MKIDSAIQLFSEKYTREAIQSIDKISREVGLVLNGHSVKGINLKESFDMFQTYLKGYAEYKINNIGNDKASSQEIIRESVQKFITENIFKEAEIGYNELPNFVQAYVEGIAALTETVDSVKRSMTDAEVEMEAVGDVNDFTDLFMDRLQESFDHVMDKILWASGYNAHQRMMKESRNKVQNKPVFL